MSVSAAERGVRLDEEAIGQEQERASLGHVVIAGGSGVKQLAAYFAGQGDIRTVETPDQVREHFGAYPPIDLFVTTISVQGAIKEDKINGVDIAASVREFSPTALTVLVTSVRPRVENNDDYIAGFDYIVDRHEVIVREKAAQQSEEEVKGTFGDFIRAAMKAKQEGTALPDNIYHEGEKKVKRPELELLTLVKEEERKPTPDEALKVSTFREEVPEDIPECLYMIAERKGMQLS